MPHLQITFHDVITEFVCIPNIDINNQNRPLFIIFGTLTFEMEPHHQK